MKKLAFAMLLGIMLIGCSGGDGPTSTSNATGTEGVQSGDSANSGKEGAAVGGRGDSKMPEGMGRTGGAPPSNP